MNSYVGIDLAWKDTNRTGLAVVDESGRLLASGAVRLDDEIADWLEVHAPDPIVVAVDAPLVVPNPKGQRMGEKLIGQAYGRYGASAYPANRGNPLFDPPRAEQLAKRFGWSVDPGTPLGGDQTVCVEVYPHPAFVGLFELPHRVLYKKGSDRRAGFLQIAALLESVPELELSVSARWSELVAVIANPARGDLTRIEDELDAILCAHLAWLWRHRRESLHVYGNVDEGYILAPPPPVHAAQLVAGATRVRQGREDELVVEVRGEAPGTFATAQGAKWKRAVLAASAECEVFAVGSRLELEVVFAMRAPRTANDRWDLDNLLKPTMDALIGPLGVRPVGVLSAQADDERIDRIIASKKLAADDSEAGARMVLRRLR